MPRKAAVSRSNSSKLLRRVLRNLLLHKRCKIVIWKTGASTSGGGAEDEAEMVGNWSISKRASPAAFAEVKEMLFNARDTGIGSSFGDVGSADEALYAAEAASCLALTVNNTRLECGCPCAEMRVTLINESRRYLGTHTARIYWDVARSKHCSACQSRCAPTARREVRHWGYCCRKSCTVY